jgi:hypothetical protein
MDHNEDVVAGVRGGPPRGSQGRCSRLKRLTTLTISTRDGRTKDRFGHMNSSVQYRKPGARRNAYLFPGCAGWDFGARVT